LFLIQWIGGVYCLFHLFYYNLDEDFKNADAWMWIVCISFGWLCIILYVYKRLRESSTSSASTNITSEQTWTVNNIPQAQTHTVNTTPTILDEQKLLDYIKAMPVKWTFSSSCVLKNESLEKLCSQLINSESVLNALDPEIFGRFELVIQLKRERASKKEDYKKVMEKNMLFELYKYSYMMNTFQILENIENDLLKIDRVKLWNMIQEDCHKRIENFEQEERNNLAIRDTFQKYEYDTQKIKLVINDYVEPREYDYIYLASMTNVLLAIYDIVLSDAEIDIGNGYQQILQVIKQYPASDIMAVLDIFINSFVNLRLGLYANGGKLYS